MRALGIIIIIVAIGIAIYASQRWPRQRRRISSNLLQKGQPLPEFSATDEDGKPVRSSDLQGTAAVMLFVRGNWCPFCSSQVEDLIAHYKSITDLGARLILVTPKPLQTTRRVAEFFAVDFDFWLDEGLVAINQLGLLQESGVPEEYRSDYGADTVWPMALVVDAAGVIRYAERSKRISDRPDAKTLLRELRAAVNA